MLKAWTRLGRRILIDRPFISFPTHMTFHVCTQLACRDGLRPRAWPVVESSRPADASGNPAPSIEEIIRILKAKEAEIVTLQVTFLCRDEYVYREPKESNQNQLPPSVRKAEITWEVVGDGRGRMSARAERSKGLDDGSTAIEVTTMLSTFNGQNGRRLKTNREGQGDATHEVLLGEHSLTFLHDYRNPFDMTTQYGGVPISKVLEDGKATIVDAEQRGDRPVVVLETTPSVSADWHIVRQRFWIDAERGAIVRRQNFEQQADGQNWRLESQLDAEKFAEGKPGVWLPGAATFEQHTVLPRGVGTHKERYAMANWVINQEIDSSRFEQEFPDGTNVIKRPEDIVQKDFVSQAMAFKPGWPMDEYWNPKLKEMPQTCSGSSWETHDLYIRYEGYFWRDVAYIIVWRGDRQSWTLTNMELYKLPPVPREYKSQTDWSKRVIDHQAKGGLDVPAYVARPNTAFLYDFLEIQLHGPRPGIAFDAELIHSVSAK